MSETPEQRIEALRQRERDLAAKKGKHLAMLEQFRDENGPTRACSRSPKVTIMSCDVCGEAMERRAIASALRAKSKICGPCYLKRKAKERKMNGKS